MSEWDGWRIFEVHYTGGPADDKVINDTVDGVIELFAEANLSVETLTDGPYEYDG